VKEARSQNRGLAKITAVHEAGHAVARYFTAGELGFETDEAIFYIDIVFDPNPHMSRDGKAVTSSSAATFGPMYSRPMIDCLRSNPVPQDMGVGHPVTLRAEIDTCKAGGIDVARWAVLKAFVCLAGAAAEAKFSGRPPDEVMESYECENDVADALRACKLAGLSTEEAAQCVCGELDQAVEFFAEPQIWRAVLALADGLPVAGRLQGKRAAAIIGDALSAA
jgi:hypothetical protein